MDKRFIIFSAIVLSLLFCSASAYALTIGPARLEVRLPAGEVAGADYYAQNNTSDLMHVIVEPENWFQGSYDYKGLEAKDWVTVEPAEFDLKPKEIKKVLVKVRVPKNAKGEIVAQIFFTSMILDSAGNAGGNMRSRLGGVLYVAIKDTEKTAAEIRDISVANLNAEDKKQIKVDVVLRNDGNVHIRPASGEVLIKDEKDRQVAQLNLDIDHAALPNKDFDYTAVWDKPELKEGKYRVFADIRYGKMYGKEKTAKLEKVFEVDKDGKVSPK